MRRESYAIEVQDLGKVYKRWDGPWARALEAVTRGRRVGHREVRALEGVSFQLPRGGSLGLVGPNGAGKSTLLKLLSETATPSAGRFRTSGRVASLLELGTGFHPGFSARENAFQNAVPIGQLPVVLAETLTGRGPCIRIPLADDVQAAAAEGALEQCALRLGLSACAREDRIEVRLNGEVLDAASAAVSYSDWTRYEWRGYPGGLGDVTYSGATMSFELPGPPLRRGDNELEVRLLHRAEPAPVPMRLVDVEISMSHAPASPR